MKYHYSGGHSDAMMSHFWPYAVSKHKV